MLSGAQMWRIRFVPEIVTTTKVVTKTTREPIDFATILGEIVKGIQAKVAFHKGELALSEKCVRSCIDCIETHLHVKSPLLIPLRILLAEVLQSCKESPVKFRQQLKTASEIVAAIGASPHPFAAARDQLLANWHVQLSEYDIAVYRYGTALQHSASCRSDEHPDHLGLQVDMASAKAADSVGSKCSQTVLNQSLATVWRLVESLKSSLSCYDYRIGLAMRSPSWICFLCGGAASANRGFDRNRQYWWDRDGALGLGLDPSKQDPRQAESQLGWILTSIELKVKPQDCRDCEVCDDCQHCEKCECCETCEFCKYCILATREVTKPMVAFELNRIGMLMMRAQLCDAAKYCFQKSIELYASQDYSGFHPTSRDNLNELKNFCANQKVPS